MIDLPLLRRLAELAGVGTAYRDAFGGWREVPPDALAVTLDALGIGVRSADEVAARIAALEEAPWRAELEPVAVVLDEEAWPEVLVALRVVDKRDVGGRAMIRCALPLPGPLPLGYHRFELRGGAGVEGAMALI